MILSDCIFCVSNFSSFTLTNQNQWITHTENQMIIHSGIQDCLAEDRRHKSRYHFRILVPSDSVGAVIGKQGATVKQIKQTTHAK